MKIALFSDIHSNLPALEAFFKDLETINRIGFCCFQPLSKIREKRKAAAKTLVQNVLTFAR